MSSLRRVATAAGWALFLGVALAMAHRLPGPSVLPWDASGSSSGDAAWTVVGLVRLVALALGWYLAVATVVAVACRIVGWHSAAATVAAATPRLVRRVLHVTVGISLLSAPAPALGLGSGPTLTVGDAADDETITMRRIDRPATHADSERAHVAPAPPAAATPHAGADPLDPQAERSGSDTIVMRRLPDVAHRHHAGAPRTWTIEPGQHLWAIATQLVGEHLGREATDGEVDPYWRRLIAANEHRLPVRGEPDLVYPGDVLDVPPVVTTSG